MELTSYRVRWWEIGSHSVERSQISKTSRWKLVSQWPVLYQFGNIWLVIFCAELALLLQLNQKRSFQIDHFGHVAKQSTVLRMSMLQYSLLCIRVVARPLKSRSLQKSKVTLIVSWGFRFPIHWDSRNRTPRWVRRSAAIQYISGITQIVLKGEKQLRKYTRKPEGERLCTNLLYCTCNTRVKKIQHVCTDYYREI